MWARRCGAPPKWPSRVKVVIMSIGTLGIGVAVWYHLRGDDVSYMDLHNPRSDRVMCLKWWPLRSENPADYVDKDQWQEWEQYRFSESAFIASQTCAVPHLSETSCIDVHVPMTSIGRKLGRPLGVGDTLSNDVFDVYAGLFFVFGGLVWLQVLAHDLSLLFASTKNYVLDLAGIREEFPCIHKVFQMMGSSRHLIRCRRFNSRSGRLLGIGIAIFMGPLAAIWSCIVFLLLCVPLVSLVFLWYPARMSRFGAFLAGLVCGIYGLVLAIHNVVSLCMPETRANYAVTWPSAGSDCICGCVYPLNSKIVGQFAIIGAITVVKSLFLAFRCLKGLRRRNWANLLSVTFPVPVTAYAVEWVTPEGKPIKYRETKGPMKPVQGELAFDPFAMMDEQPDSADTTLHLRPVKTNRIIFNKHGKKRPLRVLEGPNARAQEYADQGQEYIGCCGFPCITSGRKGRFELEDSDCEGGERSAEPAAVAERGSVESSVANGDFTRRDSAKGCLSMDSSFACVDSLVHRMDTRDTVTASRSLRTGPTRDTPVRRPFDKDRPALPINSRGVELDDPTQGVDADRRACWRGRVELQDERLDNKDEPLDTKETEASQPRVQGHTRRGVEAAAASALEAFDGSVATAVEVFDGSVAALGFEVVWPDDGLPTIWQVMPGGEAERRGFRRGDTLAKLNGESTKGRPRAELVPVLQQRPLTIHLERAGWSQAPMSSLEVALTSLQIRSVATSPCDRNLFTTMISPSFTLHSDMSSPQQQSYAQQIEQQRSPFSDLSSPQGQLGGHDGR